jgi:hypothetical protein
VPVNEVTEREHFLPLQTDKRDLNSTAAGVTTQLPLWRSSDGLALQFNRVTVAYPGIFSGGGGQQIQLRTEDRENRKLGAVAPSQGFRKIYK